jgi:serine/threonine protein kinase
MWQLLQAVSYMHCRRPAIVHRDIKPDNVLVWGHVPSAEGIMLPIVKLSDFGTVRVVDADGLRTLVGTPQYMAPELLRLHVLGEDVRYGPPADVYSLGALLFSIIALEYPVPAPEGVQPTGWAQLVAGGGVNWSQPRIAAAGEPCRDLLHAMLDADPATRITAGQALSHPWFDSLRAMAFQVPMVAAA